MVTHAKDIVDKMNKRVITIKSGEIIRDTVGTYGYVDEDDYTAKDYSVFGNSQFPSNLERYNDDK